MLPGRTGCLAAEARLLAGLVALALLAAAINVGSTLALASTSVHIDPLVWLSACGVAFVCAGIGLLLFRRMRALRLAALLFICAIFALGGRGGITLTYLTYALGGGWPLIDAHLAEIDRLMGFDWVAMLKWFDSYPLLTRIGVPFYNAFLPEQLIIPFVLVCARQYDRAQTFILAVLLGLVLMHAIAFFTPALGAYPFYAVESAEHPHIRLVLQKEWVPHVLALRAGAPVNLDAGEFFGLITFPSFHTAVAIMAAWALWSVPSARWIGVVVNAGLVLFTPLHGSHHVADVFAGAALAVVALLAAGYLKTAWDIRDVRLNLSPATKPGRPYQGRRPAVNTDPPW